MEKEHYFKCNICGQDVDMRDLGQVFEHEHDKDLPKLDGKKYTAKKIGDNVAWNNNKPINLN